MWRPPLEGTSLVKQWRGETLGDLEPVYHLFTIMSEITLPLAATSAEHAPKSSLQNMPQKAVSRTCPQKQSAEHAPKSSWDERRVLQNAEKKKLDLGFLHSLNHTGSPKDESYMHSYFIPGQNNKSSQRKLKNKVKKRQPTILDTTQWIANITSISINISLIYN